MKIDKQSEEYCVKLCKRMVDEAIWIFKQAHKFSPDVHICIPSVKQAIGELQKHLETENGLKWVRISFCDGIGMTHVMINVDCIKIRVLSVN